MGRLDGRVALVTGGASGLGKAIATRLTAEGAAVIVSDRQRELGEQTAASFGAAFLYQDVTDEDQWPLTLQRVSELAGPVSILINNAGIAGAADRVSPEDTRLTDWKQIFTVNVDSVFLGCRAGIAAMRHTGGGSIVNMSSIAALLATPDSTAYGAAKAAVRQLTKSVAQHCATERLAIRCNSVHPGEVSTPLWDRYIAQTAEVTGVPGRPARAGGQGQGAARRHAGASGHRRRRRVPVLRRRPVHHRLRTDHRRRPDPLRRFYCASRSLDAALIFPLTRARRWLRVAERGDLLGRGERAVDVLGDEP